MLNGVSIFYDFAKDKVELLILFVAICLSYCFNYHFLWLSYDFLAIYGAILFLKNYFGFRERYIIFVVVPVLIYAFVRVFFEGHIFKGLLSVWDTLKHVFVLYTLFRVFRESEPRKFKNIVNVRGDYILKFLMVSLFVQFVVTLYQFYSRVRMDNVAGTFGDGGTHSLGYLSLACIAYVLFAEKVSWVIVLIVTFLVVEINIFAENIGFFVLVEFMVLGRILLMKRFTIKPLLSYCSLFVLIGSMVYFTPYGFILHARDNANTASVVISRALNAISVSDNSVSISSVPGNPVSKAGMPRKNVLISGDPHNRSQFMSLAWQLGGWFGYGIGAFSNIYLMQGYDSAMMHGLEINISELTHLLAEWGLVGVLLVAGFYCLFFASYFTSLRGIVFACALFVGAFMYSSVLMTEPQIFFLGIAMAVISRFERKNLASKF